MHRLYYPRIYKIIKKNKIKQIFILILNSFLFLNVFGQEVQIDAIPYKLQFENEPLEFEIIGNNRIEIVAPEKSDLFTSPNGHYRKFNSPSLIFKPDSDFVFTSKIVADFTHNLDAGVLLIYNDSSHYAKMCFEKDYQGQPRVITVICNEVADDCKSMAVDDEYVYFRIAGSTNSNVFSFYYSKDNKSWFFVRIFRLNRTDNIRIGFNVQSPKGDHCNVEFSEIQLEQRKLDFRNGD